MTTPGMDRVPSAMRNLLGNTKGIIQVLTSIPITLQTANSMFLDARFMGGEYNVNSMTL
jgi:hypothetical protein